MRRHEGVTSPALAWAAAAFVILALSALGFAQISVSRVASATRADLDNVLEVVPSGHFAYLGARVAAGMQLAHLAQEEPRPSAAALAALAHTSVDYLPGIAAFVLQDARGGVVWMVPEAASGSALRKALASLRASAHGDPGLLATDVADMPTWGRTLLVRFPLSSSPGGEALVAILSLAPLYDTLFSDEFRSRLDFEVREGSTELYRQVSEPWPDSPFRVSRSFSVAGHEWTMTVWPRRSLIAARLDQTWRTVFRIGLGSALGAALLLGIVLSRWAAMTRRTQEAEIATALLHVGQTLNAQLDQPDMLARMSHLALDALAADWTIVFVRDDDGRFGVAASAGVHLGVEQLTPDALAPLSLLRVDEIVTTSDVAVRPRPLDGLLRQLGLVSAIAVPIARGDAILAILAAGRRDHRAAFTPKQRRLALGICHTTAVALENARLIADLQAASRLKSEFVATMSHELRTPLNVITGYTDMLADECDGPLSAPQQDTLARIRRNAVDLLELVNATLDIGRLEAGRQTVDLGTFDVGDLFTTLDRELESLVPAGVTLRWRDGVGGARLVSDRVQIKTIVKNLVGNALKFTTAGSVEVSATAAGGMLTLVVRDTGIGIAPENLPVIFDMFRQADGSPTRRHGGVGLGLHIVKRVVELLGGSITVESAPAVGSTFTVVLPAPNAAAAASTAA